MKGKDWKFIIMGFAILFFLLFPAFHFTGLNSNSSIVNNDGSVLATSNEGEIVLNEISTDLDYVEIRNTGSTQDMTGWQVRIFRDNAYYRTYVFPDGWIFLGGSVLILHEGSGANTGNTLYAGWNFQWTTNVAVGLMNRTNANIDWFQSSTYTGVKPNDAIWNIDVSITFTSPYTSRINDQDTDKASDWEVTSTGTPGSINPGQISPPEPEIPPEIPILEPIPSPDTDGIIDLEWNFIENAISYFVYRDTNLIISVQGMTPIAETMTNSYQDILTSNGTYYYVVVASNAAGNSSISNIATFKLVVLALNPFGVTPSTGTEDTEFTFTTVYTSVHNHEPKFSKVQVIINGTPYEMEKQNASDLDYTDGCLYQYTTILSPGKYTYYFKCNDGFYENWTTTSELVVKWVDSDPPQIINSAPSSLYTNLTTPTISVELADSVSGIDISSIMFKVEGLVRTIDNWDGYTLTWTPSTPFLNGQVINVELSVADNAGNVMQTSWQFRIDTIPPEVLTITGDNLTYVNTQDPILIKVGLSDIISGLDTSTITLRVDGQVVPFIWDGSNVILTRTLSFSDGKTIEVTLDAYDRAGNAIPQHRWFYTIDSTPPQDFSILNPFETFEDMNPEVICQVIVSGAGLNLSSVQYAYSTTGSPTPSNWASVDGVYVDAAYTIPAQNGATGVLYIKVNAVLFNQTSLNGNTIRFRVSDLANNEIISEAMIVSIPGPPQAPQPFSPLLFLVIAVGAVSVGAYSSYILIRSRRKEKQVQKLLHKVLMEPREPSFINPLPVEGTCFQSFVPIPEYSAEEYLTPTEYVEPIIEDQSPPITLQPEPSEVDLNFNIPYITFMQLLRIMNTLTSVFPRLDDMIPKDERLPYLMDLKSLPDEKIFARIVGLITNIPDDELLANIPTLMADLNECEDIGYWHHVLNRITDLVIIAESENNYQFMSELVLLLTLIKHTSIMTSIPSRPHSIETLESPLEDSEGSVIEAPEPQAELPAALQITRKLITVIPYDDLLSQIPGLIAELNSLENLERWDPVLNRITELLIIAESSKNRKLLNDLVQLIILIKHA